LKEIKRILNELMNVLDFTLDEMINFLYNIKIKEVFTFESDKDRLDKNE